MTYAAKDNRPVSFMTKERTRALIRERDDAVSRAEKAEHERDAWKDIAQQTARSIEALRAEQPRPLTPDDITDEMVERAWNRWLDLNPLDRDSMRLTLTAALTEPPARPEGAEELAAAMEARLGEFALEHIDVDGLADHLATLGYRKGN